MVCLSIKQIHYSFLFQIILHQEVKKHFQILQSSVITSMLYQHLFIPAFNFNLNSQICKLM